MLALLLVAVSSDFEEKPRRFVAEGRIQTSSVNRCRRWQYLSCSTTNETLAELVSNLLMLRCLQYEASCNESKTALGSIKSVPLSTTKQQPPK
ncbi:hypothetical protein OH492_03655 [Vibrio chagasii]|nr:hypothetical protein [Vibrio chagasii]